MVDCRLCKNSYTIYKGESGLDEKILICLEREMKVDWKYAIKGECELYVDVDGYDPEIGSDEA